MSLLSVSCFNNFGKLVHFHPLKQLCQRGFYFLTGWFKKHLLWNYVNYNTKMEPNLTGSICRRSLIKLPCIDLFRLQTWLTQVVLFFWFVDLSFSLKHDQLELNLHEASIDGPFKISSFHHNQRDLKHGCQNQK